MGEKSSGSYEGAEKEAEVGRECSRQARHGEADMHEQRAASVERANRRSHARREPQCQHRWNSCLAGGLPCLSLPVSLESVELTARLQEIATKQDSIFRNKKVMAELSKKLSEQEDRIKTSTKIKEEIQREISVVAKDIKHIQEELQDTREKLSKATSTKNKISMKISDLEGRLEAARKKEEEADQDLQVEEAWRRLRPADTAKSSTWKS